MRDGSYTCLSYVRLFPVFAIITMATGTFDLPKASPAP